MKTELTLKQENFCLAYVETGNASEAYRRSYNAERMKPETITKRASELLSNGVIAGRLAELRVPIIEKTGINLERVLIENAHVAFFDMKTILFDDGTLKPISQWPAASAAAISSIEIFEKYEGTGNDRKIVGHLTKVKLVEKGAALDRLMKYLGAYERDNKQKQENNPMYLFMQQIMGTALPVAKNPHLIE